jgi:hypothetical protein
MIWYISIHRYCSYCSPDKNSVFGSNKCVWKQPLTVTEKSMAEIQNTDGTLPCSMYCLRIKQTRICRVIGIY